MEDMMPKVRAIRAEIERLGLAVDVEVDGGIGVKNTGIVTEAGANALVAGSAIFRADDPAQVILDMQKAAR